MSRGSSPLRSGANSSLIRQASACFCAMPPTCAFGLAPAGQPAFGVDPHQRSVERQGAAEIADMLPVRRDRDVHPERLDRFDFHLYPPRVEEADIRSHLGEREVKRAALVFTPRHRKLSFEPWIASPSTRTNAAGGRASAACVSASRTCSTCSRPALA